MGGAKQNEGFQLNPTAPTAKLMWLHTILIASCSDSAKKLIKQTHTNTVIYTGSMTQMECRPGPLFHGTYRGTHCICLVLHKSVCPWLPALPLHSSTEGEVIHQYSRGYGCESPHKQFLLPQKEVRCCVYKTIPRQIVKTCLLKCQTIRGHQCRCFQAS